MVGQEKESEQTQKIIHFEPCQGSGTIMSSARTVYGEGTKFLSELKNNDFIVADHPKSKKLEERKIMSILSNQSLLVQDPFSDDIVHF